MGLIPCISAGEGKIFVINSYDDAYVWGVTLMNAVKSTVGDKAELRIMNLDSKHKPAEAEKRRAALAIKKAIDEWKPDVIIAADDNASKYVIVPYYKNTQYPVIFCGINWDASEYGFPCSNVTGMLEVNLIDKCVESIRRNRSIRKIGFLGENNETDRKESVFCSKRLGMQLDAVFVSSYADWEKEYSAMQKRVDLLVLQPVPEIDKVDSNRVKKFIQENTLIPTVSTLEFNSDYSLLTYARLPEEHGTWAALAALEILGGKKISEIKMTESKQSKLIVNMNLLNKLEFVLPLPVLKTAKLINGGKEPTTDRKNREEEPLSSARPNKNGK